MAQLRSADDLRKVLPAARESTKAKILDCLDEQATAFIQKCPFLLLASTDPQGNIEVSPKGDEPGFVRVENAKTLLMPERAGNNLAIGLQNIIANGRVGLIFLLPQTGETLRVSGRAQIFDDVELVTRLSSKDKPALLAIRIQIDRSYFHCARAILRAQLWQPQGWPKPEKVSFGRIIAPRIGGDAAAAEQIDQFVNSGYATNLWQNR